MNFRRLVTLISVIFFTCTSSNAQINAIFQQRDTAKLDSVLSGYNNNEGMVKYAKSEVSTVMSLFLNKYFEKNNLNGKVIFLKPSLLSIHFDKQQLDTVEGNPNFNFTDKLISVSREGFYIENKNVKTLEIDENLTDQLLTFLYGRNFESNGVKNSIELYQQKLEFLKNKLALKNTNIVLGKGRGNKLVNKFTIDYNLNILLLSFNSLKNQSTILYEDQYTISIAYLKKNNGVWGYMSNNHIVQY